MLSDYKCPHCEIRLRAQAGKFYCGICGGEFVSSQLKKDPNAKSDSATLDFAREYLKEHKKLEDAKRGDVRMVHVDNLGHVSNFKLFFSFFGVPVEEDEQDHGFPLVLGLFIFACVAIFAILSPVVQESMALDPKQLWRFKGLNFISYSLIHGDIFHIIGNLFFLFPFIDNTEYKLGHFKSFLFLVFAAISSAALHLIFDKSLLPLVGASGVCFAVLVYYSVKFPSNRLLIMPPFLGIWGMKYRIRVKARTLVIFYVIKELIGTSFQLSGMSEVSHLGHLGGALTGLFFAYFVNEEN